MIFVRWLSPSKEAPSFSFLYVLLMDNASSNQEDFVLLLLHGPWMERGLDGGSIAAQKKNRTWQNPLKKWKLIKLLNSIFLGGLYNPAIYYVRGPVNCGSVVDLGESPFQGCESRVVLGGSSHGNRGCAKSVTCLTSSVYKNIDYSYGWSEASY